MAQMFWKKLIILNLGLIIVIVRLYGLFISKIEKQKNNTSVFPSEDENGYPFFDQISCNLQQLYLISHHFGNNTIKPKEISIDKSSKCEFYPRIAICKGNKKCNNNLMKIEETMFDTNNYHYYNKNFSGIMYWNEIVNVNNFNDTEMAFLYKIISGYHTYVDIMIHKDDYNAIKSKVAFSYEYLNSLFYLHSLLLYSAEIIDIKYSFNNTFINNYSRQCLQFSENDIDKLSSQVKKEIPIILNQIELLTSCITDTNSKYSSLVDIQGIKTMFKILMKQSITNQEKDLFEFFSMNVYKSIYYLFDADYNIKGISMRYRDYEAYIIISFFGLGVTIMLFINKYFIQHRDLFDRKGKKLSSKLAQMEKYKESISKKENPNNKNCSPEDLEYLEKLKQATGEANADFVITK